MPTALQGRAQTAARQTGYRFRHRDGRRNEDCLKPCWRAIRPDAAAGGDHVSAQVDDQPRDATSHDLVERLPQTRCRAPRVRRHDSPNGDGTQRPLGNPAVEDTRWQLAGARLLEAIDAQDFRRCRDGDRPPVGALAAGDTRTIKRPFGRDAWGVAADLQPSCATLDPAWLVRMVAARSEDGARLRLMRPWRPAGVLDPDGQGLHPGTGTPPGGPVSPVRATVVVPDGLDVWGATVVKRHGRGEAGLMRSADDCVGAVENPAEAERVSTVRGRRLAPCGLERSGAKTRLIPCSRQHLAGKTRCEWLGCECRGGQDRQGRDHRTRRTARKPRRPSLTRFTAWGQANRHVRVPVLGPRRNATLRGYDNSDGVHGTAASLQAFVNNAIRRGLTWRHRRSPRHSYTWHGYPAVRERFPVARPRIVGRPQTRQAALKA
jgi:hypothetical protein